MKKKIVGILVMTLLIATILSITGTANADNHDQEVVFNRYFYFGILELIDPEEYNFDFVIGSFAILIGKGEIIRLNEGDMIRLHSPMFGIVINKFHIGIISDWSPIR
jgi:hypothetical protein